MSWGSSSNDSNYGDSSGTSDTSDSGSGSGGKYSMYVNIGLAILAVLILLFLIGAYYNKKSDPKEEHFANSQQVSSQPNNQKNSSELLQNTSSSKEVEPQRGIGKNEVYASVPTNVSEPGNKFGLHGNQYPNDCFPKDTLSAAELLPNDPNSKWAQVNPSGQGELGDQNFLEAGFHVGVNTVGQTLRNANMQLRSEPPCPQVKVSPWMQTTIEPDTNRKPLEIGGY